MSRIHRCDICEKIFEYEPSMIIQNTVKLHDFHMKEVGEYELCEKCKNRILESISSMRKEGFL